MLVRPTFYLPQVRFAPYSPYSRRHFRTSSTSPTSLTSEIQNEAIHRAISKNAEQSCDRHQPIKLLVTNHLCNIIKYSARWFGKSIHSFSDSSFSRGVSILLRKDLDIEIVNSHSSIDGRKLLLNLKFDNNIFTNLSIYAPNTELNRIEFFKNVCNYITRYSVNVDSLIVCGDFNCSFERYDESTDKLKCILRKLNLVDVWSEKHKDLQGFTWCDASNTPKSRIDFVFISKDFVYDIDKILIRRIPGTHSNGTRMSDHRLLKFILKISENTRGPGYWKLNVSHLENEDYREGIMNIIQNLDEQGYSLDKWEYFKSQVNDFSVKYSKQRQTNLKNTIRSIQKQIEEINDSSSECFDMNRKRELEDRLSELYDKKCKGAQIRSRSKWINEGEKNTSYFLNLEKRHQSSNVINPLPFGTFWRILRFIRDTYFKSYGSIPLTLTIINDIPSGR